MNFWSIAYQQGWATKDQLKQAVEYGLIKDTDYKAITGEAYEEDDADESTEDTGNH